MPQEAITELFEALPTPAAQYDTLLGLVSMTSKSDLIDACQSLDLLAFHDKSDLIEYAEQDLMMYTHQDFTELERERDELAQNLEDQGMQDGDNLFTLKEWEAWRDRLEYETPDYRAQMIAAICETTPKMV